MKLINMFFAVAAAQQQKCSGTITRERTLQLATRRVKLNRCDLVAMWKVKNQEKPKPAPVNMHHWRVRTSDVYRKLGYQF